MKWNVTYFRANGKKSQSSDCLIKIVSLKIFWVIRLTTSSAWWTSQKSIYDNEKWKFSALARTAPYMDIGEGKILLNTFFNAQLNYCMLI